MNFDAILNELEYYKILDYISKYTNTEVGEKNIKNIIPLINKAAIIEEGNLVEEAKSILIEDDYPPFEFIPDLSIVLSRSTIEGVILKKREILYIKKLAELSRFLNNYLMKHEESAQKLLQIKERLFVDKSFEKKIDKVFDENGEVSDNASEKLREIRKDKKRKNSALDSVVKKILKSLSDNYLVQDEYVTQRDGRMVMPVKAEHKRHVKGFIHSESATGQTVYIEPEETLDLNNEILSLSFAERREIEKIFHELTKHIAQNSEKLKISLFTVGQIDSIFARAKYSIEVIGSFPTIDINKKIHILDGRHPLLLRKLGRSNTVPLNIEIDKEKIILITGPNAGGKTVVLKSFALLILLVQSGIHVPMNPDSNIHIFEKVLFDIGDQQSIEEDLSTFSSHLTNIKEILKSADSKSLVIIDEIGTGTDPSEGSALASAVLMSLKEKSSLTLATTHHGTLKMLAHDTDGFQNASMEYDLKNLKPTYKFKQGIPGSSYAFEVAQRIGFSTDLLKLAEKYLDADKNKIEKFLVELEKNSNELNKRLNSMEIENSRLKGLTNLYKDKIDKLEKRKSKIVAETQQEAENYLKDVNKQVEQAIKSIKESNAKSDIIKKERKKLEDIKNKNKEYFIPKTKKREIQQIKNKELKVGDHVQVNDTSTIGEILEINKTKNKAVIASGSIKLQVKLSSLIPTKVEKEKTERTYGIEYKASLPSTRKDIRGLKPEEAEYEIIRFLDDAYSSDVKQVEIIHGKGSGILKRTVHEILEASDYVKNYYFAKVELGGDGVTIIEL